MIRFYIDGTTGQKDGTEVTSINPITATGLFPSGSYAYVIDLIHSIE